MEDSQKSFVKRSLDMFGLSIQFWKLIIICGLASCVMCNTESMCSVDEAQKCLTQRQEAVARESALFQQTLSVSESLQTLCLSQVVQDDQGKCFQHWTQLCPADTVVDIRTQWSAVNTAIVKLCSSVCPNFLEVSTCKNMTDTNSLAGGTAYETFCRSFNDSLICANTALFGCQFGVDIFYAVQEKTSIHYWKRICNSGCHNIDESIAEFVKCTKNLVNTRDKSVLCLGHERFKECIQTSTVVCDEIMTLVMFKYPSYSRIDYLCRTTTTSTTTPLPDTTTTPPPPETTTTTTTPEEVMETTEALPTLNFSECLSSNSLPRLTDGDTMTREKLKHFLQFETCIHELGGDLDAMHRAVKMLSKDVQQSLAMARKHYSQLLDTECPETKSAQTSGCSGHEYGLIPCSGKSGSLRCVALMSVVYLVTFTSLHIPHLV